MFYLGCAQGRRQEFAKEQEGVWETEVPQRGPGAKPGGGLGMPQKLERNVDVDSTETE